MTFVPSNPHNVPVSETKRFTSQLRLDEFSSALQGFTRDRRGRVSTHSSPFIASFGSRAAMRFFGVNMKAGRARLPFLLRADLQPSEGAAIVTLNLESDEGYYAFGRLAVMDIAYQELFSHLVAELEIVLNGKEVDSEL